jgi:hypothetical protein
MDSAALQAGYPRVQSALNAHNLMLTIPALTVQLFSAQLYASDCFLELITRFDVRTSEHNTPVLLSGVEPCLDIEPHGLDSSIETIVRNALVPSGSCSQCTAPACMHAAWTPTANWFDYFFVFLIAMTNY